MILFYLFYITKYPKFRVIMRKTQKKRQSLKLPLASTVYAEKDYDSNNGFLTPVWGPSMWHVLHTISFNYPAKPTDCQKRKYREFIMNLKHVLPCGKCRKNLYKNMEKLPLTMKHMKSRATFSRYIYDLHEVVNDMLNKKSGLTYEDVKERYEHFRARCAVSGGKTKKRLPKHKKEEGCVQPLVGEKAKCILKIVPQDTKCETFQVDEKCVKHRQEGSQP